MIRIIYAVTTPPTGALGVPGLRNERLTVVREGRLAAIVGELPRAPRVTLRSIRAYHAVLHRLWLLLPAIVPARYPTSIQNLEELELILRSRSVALHRTIREVRRRGQMTVRIVREAGSESHESNASRDEYSSGLAYLLSRAATAARAGRVPEFEPLRPAVRRWIRAERVEKRGNIATIYHLVPRASATAYRRAVEAAAAAAGVRAIVSGPFPPYAFADDLRSGQG